MTDLEATLTAILENPDDDLPRLQYADLLDEQEQPERAEFIRVQVELAMREGYAGTNPEKWSVELKQRIATLRMRELNLWCACKAIYNGIPDDWVPVRSNPFGIAKGYVLYRRGFVESITCTWQDWHTHADAITAQHPIRHVTLTTWPLMAIGSNIQAGWWESRLYDGQSNLVGKPGILSLLDPYSKSAQAYFLDPNSGNEFALLALKATWPRIEFELPKGEIYPVHVHHLTAPLGNADVVEIDYNSTPAH